MKRHGNFFVFTILSWTSPNMDGLVIFLFPWDLILPLLSCIPETVFLRAPCLPAFWLVQPMGGMFLRMEGRLKRETRVLLPLCSGWWHSWQWLSPLSELGSPRKVLSLRTQFLPGWPTAASDSGGWLKALKPVIALHLFFLSALGGKILLVCLNTPSLGSQLFYDLYNWFMELNSS